MHYGGGDELTKLEFALEATGSAWWWMELPSGIVFFSPNKTAMLGREEEKFVHYKDFTALVHPDDLDTIMDNMRSHLKGESSMYETTYRIKHADGHYVRFYDKGKIVGRNGNTTQIAGFVYEVEKFKHIPLNDLPT